MAREDGPAVEIALTSLWHRDNPVAQGMQAHAACFGAHLHEDIIFDPEIFDRD